LTRIPQAIERATTSQTFVSPEHYAIRLGIQLSDLQAMVEDAFAQPQRLSLAGARTSDVY